MTDPETDTTTTKGGEPAGDDQLGEAGKRALEAERNARKQAEARAREAEQRASELERRDLLAAVAAEKGLTEAQAARLVGESREELEADADELLEAFRPPSAAHQRRPKERLRPGAVPAAESTTDMGSIADRIVRGV